MHIRSVIPGRVFSAMYKLSHVYRKIITNDETYTAFLKEKGVLPVQQQRCEKVNNGEICNGNLIEYMKTVMKRDK